MENNLTIPQKIELNASINRITSDLQKGKKLIRLHSGQYCFIVGKKLRQVEHPAIDKLMEDKKLHETFKFRGVRHYRLIALLFSILYFTGCKNEDGIKPYVPPAHINQVQFVHNKCTDRWAIRTLIKISGKYKDTFYLGAEGCLSCSGCIVIFTDIRSNPYPDSLDNVKIGCEKTFPTKDSAMSFWNRVQKDRKAKSDAIDKQRIADSLDKVRKDSICKCLHSYE